MQSTVVGVLLFIFVLAAANAQIKPPNLRPCFCCDSLDIYQLTPDPPPVTGPARICRCGGDIFTTVQCPGAHFIWTVANNGTPTIGFAGQGTPSITLSSFVPGTGNLVTITVKIICHNYSITGQIKVPIIPPPNLTFSYQVTYSGSGDIWTVAAQGTGNWTSYGNAWRITEVTPSDKPCNQWGYVPMCWEGPTTTPSGASKTCTLLPGHQYRIIHWMEKCRITWQATPGCLAVKMVCFTMTAGPKGAKLTKGTKAILENVSEMGPVNEPKPEMMPGKKWNFRISQLFIKSGT